MANLENSMFVLPDRMAVLGGEMYVRFPTELVARAGGIRQLWLHFPLPGLAENVVLQIREVESPWDEGVFAGPARPRHHPRLLAEADCSPMRTEDAAAIDPVLDRWMYHGRNFGLLVTQLQPGSGFGPDRPPFLEIVYEPARERVS